MRTALLVLALTACVHTIRLPESVRRNGGYYVPWDSVHAAHRADVLACVGLTPKEPEAHPTLWISPRPMVDSLYRPLHAYYDWIAHAIIYSPNLPMADYWAVFRHEAIHASERTGGPHSARFALYKQCNFWPDLTPR